MDETIKKALDIITETGDKYTSKSSHCWVSFLDVDGWLTTFDNYNDYTFCEDCIDKVIEAVDEKIKSGKQEKPEGYVSTDYQVDSSPENDDFCNCECCGEIIAASSFWSDQEMGHWLDDEQRVTKWDEVIKDPRQCYELMKIFEPVAGACEKFPQQTKEIALKIIKADETKD